MPVKFLTLYGQIVEKNMKTMRVLQFQHVCDTIRSIDKNLADMPFDDVEKAVAHRVVDCKDVSTVRYAAMILSIAKGNTTREDLR